jgi:hypothetical protein
MYVATRQPGLDAVVAKLAAGTEMSADEAKRLLHATRALPVPQGAGVGWGFEVLHWGAPYVSGPERVSLSFEFIPDAAAPVPEEQPLVDLAGPLPGLDARLRAIAIGLTSYGRFDASVHRARLLAAALLA